jgi:putative acetyltransferase
MEIIIRPIQISDNPIIAKIIRTSLEDLGANLPGTVYFEESTDHLFELFNSNKNCAYFIAELNGEIIGGTGYFSTDGLPSDTCELVKVFLTKTARGKGLGYRMLNNCVDAAKNNGFKKMYLETITPSLIKAVKLYEQFGFEYLTAPLGNSGHNACNIWMQKVIA